MPKLLVTDPNGLLCPAAIVDPEEGYFEALSLFSYVGVRGASRNGNWVVFGVQGHDLGCLCFAYYQQGRLFFADCVSLMGVSDIHDVKWDRDKIMVVSSSNDRIYSFDMNTAGLTLVSFYHTEELDTRHRNSICKWKGTWWASQFGIKPFEGWRPASQGEVRRIKPNWLTKDPKEDALKEVPLNMDYLVHPHSLSIIQDQLIVCESGTGCIKGALTTSTLVELSGYIRGMAYSQEKERLYVGSSSIRAISKHQGTPIENLPESDPCGIYTICTETWKVLSFYELPIITEIYELVLLEP